MTEGKLKICAIAPKDGYAVFMQNERMYMIRPPFRLSERVAVDPSALGKAVVDYGFEEADKECDDLPALIRYLQEQIIAHNPKPTDAEITEAAKKILRLAEPSSVERFLVRLREEMAQRRWVAAHNGLSVLLENLNVKDNQEVREQVEAMMRECVLSLDRSRPENMVKHAKKPSLLRKFTISQGTQGLVHAA